MDRGRQEEMAYVVWLSVSFLVICAVFYACDTFHSVSGPGQKEALDS